MEVCLLNRGSVGLVALDVKCPSCRMSAYSPVSRVVSSGVNAKSGDNVPQNKRSTIGDACSLILRTSPPLPHPPLNSHINRPDFGLSLPGGKVGCVLKLSSIFHTGTQNNYFIQIVMTLYFFGCKVCSNFQKSRKFINVLADLADIPSKDYTVLKNKK